MLKYKLLLLIITTFIFTTSVNSFAATLSYQYDNLHRLTRVDRSDGSVTIYQYDNLGNRTSMVTTVVTVSYYCDKDHDVYINSSLDDTCTGIGCQPAECQTIAGNDCNDSNALINPATRWYPDSDNDGYGNPTIAYVQCTQPSGPPNYVLNNGDYNDNDRYIYPGGPAVRVAGTSPSYYSTLQAAYNAASEGDNIQVQAIIFNESLSVNLDKTVTISGGFNGAYSSQSGKTTIQGNISVTDGVFTIGDVIMQ